MSNVVSLDRSRAEAQAMMIEDLEEYLEEARSGRIRMLSVSIVRHDHTSASSSLGSGEIAEVVGALETLKHRILAASQP